MKESVFLLCLCALDYFVSSHEMTVSTGAGTVQGIHKQSYKDRTFLSFEGIPYAKPPVGDLRFQDPQSPDKWNGIFVANETYTCLQYLPFPVIGGIKGKEDCLYLNVYIPRETIDVNANLDVVVQIHGGAFMIGNPKWMADPRFMMDQDVICVTMNYRVGILGFLSTEDSVVPGNNGLKDQALALKWVKENIKSFGGNADSITITGLSAGGASVHFHYLSPISRGLFHKGLSQSGTALHCYALTENPLEKARFVADKLGCNKDSTQEMVDCLRTIPKNDLITGATKILVHNDMLPVTPFGPVVENTKAGFLTQHPYEIFKNKNVYDVPWIASNVKDEGLFPVGFIDLMNMFEEVDTKWNTLAPYALDFNDTVAESQKIEVSLKIREKYFGSAPVTKQNADTLIEVFNHRMYFMDTEKALRLHSQAVKSPVYHYKFSYILKMPNFFPMKGVSHGDDGKLIFRVVGTPNVLEEDDEKVMNLLTSFVATYAKTGVPKVGNIDWSPVKPGSTHIDYLHISSPNDISMETIDEFGPTQFWASLPIKENEKLFA